jgi:hypothetical protein
MNLYETRVLDLERERDSLTAQCKQFSIQMDELKKQVSISRQQIETKNREIYILRGQNKMLTQNKMAQDMDIASLRVQV